MQLSSKKVQQFQEKIFFWYNEHKRSLPWRQTRDPYSILISEVMSQQTQLSRVVSKYQDWMQRFPTIGDLANARVSEVLHFWSGLGYNRRALNLKKAAEIIVKEYNGQFPHEEKQLLSLPGIGKYTARAILCFAFGEQIAVVDTNIRRVILTQIQISKIKYQNLKEGDFYTIAEQLLPKGRAYDWNQALMDYAAAMLKKEKIVIPKQSKFLGSHRYYRGQILKYLLKNKRVTFENLAHAIKKDYITTEKEWLKKLVKELTDEGFIVEEQGMIMLVS